MDAFLFIPKPTVEQNQKKRKFNLTLTSYYYKFFRKRNMASKKL